MDCINCRTGCDNISLYSKGSTLTLISWSTHCNTGEISPHLARQLMQPIHKKEVHQEWTPDVEA